jgi:DNA polymerase-3 subunit delta'
LSNGKLWVQSNLKPKTPYPHFGKTKPQSTIKKINAIMDARTNLSHNVAPLLTVEALMCVLAR